MSDDSITVEMEQFTVGKSEGCDLMLTHPSIGRAHAKIYFTLDMVLIEDLDSQSGTFVYYEGAFKRIKSAKIKYDTKIRLGTELDPISVRELIDDYKLSKEKKKKDIFRRVKAVGLKRCNQCGTVLEKSKIHCECCGAIFEESA